MKTLKKRYFAIRVLQRFVMLFFPVMACAVSAHTVHAEVRIDKPVQTVYLRSNDAAAEDALPEMLFYIELSDGDRINEASVRSDNETVSGKINCYRPKNIEPLSWYTS